MAGIFLITAEKILVLMCFFVAGFLFAGRKDAPEDAPYTLSRLLTELFCPALTISGMASNLGRSVIRANVGLIVTSTGLMAAGIVISRLLSRILSGEDRDLRAVLRYNLLFSNYGYIGYPMILGVFGEAVLARFLLFAVPINICVNFYGRMAVEGEKPTLRFLLSPLSLSTFIGLVIGISEIRLPAVAAEVLSTAGNCTGPVAMLVTGMVLSKVNIRSCLCDWKNYLFALLRLVILPLAAYFFMRLTGIRGEAFLFTGCFLCLPFGSNPVVFREARGMDTRKAAGMTLVSYLLSLAAVPLMFSLFYNFQM